MLVKILLNNICVSILVSLIGNVVNTVDSCLKYIRISHNQSPKNLTPIHAVIKMEQERVIIISIVEYSLSMIVPLLRCMKTNTINKLIT